MNTLVARLLLRCSRAVSLAARRERASRDEREREEGRRAAGGKRRVGGRRERERKSLQEGGCLIKQFRYGARRNMRSYPPSLNARFLWGYLSATPRRSEKKQRGESAGERYNPRRVYTRSQEATFPRKFSTRGSSGTHFPDGGGCVILMAPDVVKKKRKKEKNNVYVYFKIYILSSSQQGRSERCSPDVDEPPLRA